MTGGIPIPSFRTPMSSSSPAAAVPASNKASSTTKANAMKNRKSNANNNMSSVSTNKSTTTDTLIPARWNTVALIQLEVSLQHWFRRQKKTSMTLADFFSLVQTLDWDQTSTATKEEKECKEDNTAVATTKMEGATEDLPKTEDKLHPHDVQCQGLSKEERLFHDLICATAHPDLKEPLYKLDVAQGFVELFPHGSDQMRRLLHSSTRTLDKNWSDQIRILLTHHGKAQQGKEDAATKKQQDAMAAKQQQNGNKPLTAPKAARITADMTIDARVRARAKAKADHESFLMERTLREPKRTTNLDRAWMLQLADALWNHARTRLQRQNYQLPGKLASNSLLHPKRASSSKAAFTNNKSNSRCVMTFADVIQTISKSRLGEATPTQIAKALTELEECVPKWIVVKREFAKDASGAVPSSKSKAASFRWSRSATTVFITPDNYPAVRSQLTGIPLVQTKSLKNPIGVNNQSRTTTTVSSTATKATTNETTITTSSSSRVVVTQDTRSKVVSSANKNRKRASRSSAMSKNLLLDFDTTNVSIGGKRGGTGGGAKRAKTSTAKTRGAR